MQSVPFFEEHPLDYEWRFSGRTRDELVSRLRDRDTLMMSTPTIAMALQTQARNAVLIDRQPLYSVLVRNHIVADLCASDAPLPDRNFDTILIDSPWYVDHLVRWLNYALQLARVGATHIWFTLWPQNTRPNAARERCFILESLGARGTVMVIADGVDYDIPAFEHYATDRVERRTGDLVRFEPLISDRLPEPRIVAATTWLRYTFGRRQIALKVVNDHDEESAELSPVYPGTWYQQTVSRRDPMRHRISLWASNGLAASVRGTRQFHEALKMLSLGEGIAAMSNGAATATELLRRHGLLPPHYTSRGAEWVQREWMTYS